MQTNSTAIDMDKKLTPNELMQRAIYLSEQSVLNGGGPFGAVIAKDGRIIAEASNSVRIDEDPTAHAEVNAIRKACNKLETFNLGGYEIYTSCEPCPMCLGAIYWAKISTIYYANDRTDAAEIGFDDDLIYRELKTPMDKRCLPIRQILREEAQKAFQMWQDKTDKEKY